MKPDTRKTYMKLYHPINVEDAIKGSVADQCLQGINKWIGVTKAINSTAYIDGSKLIFTKDHTYFSLSGATCAICSAHHNPVAATKKQECITCPLFNRKGRRCDTVKGEHTLALEGDAVHMIELLNEIMMDDLNTDE